MLTITGCSDIITVEWDVPGATQLVLMSQRHERIIAIGKTGSQLHVLMDEVQIRDVNGNILESQKITPCLDTRYRIMGQHVHILKAGRYIFHKRMGFTLDTWWKLLKKGEYTPGQTVLLGPAGNYAITWSQPGSSKYKVDTVEIY